MIESEAEKEGERGSVCVCVCAREKDMRVEACLFASNQLVEFMSKFCGGAMPRNSQECCNCWTNLEKSSLLQKGIVETCTEARSIAMGSKNGNRKANMRGTRIQGTIM